MDRGRLHVLYVDCTFGRGGHSSLVLSKLSDKGRLIAIDRDPTAIAAAEKFKDDSRFLIEHQGFAALSDIADKHQKRFAQKCQTTWKRPSPFRHDHNKWQGQQNLKFHNNS